jgi:hypothetical protein
MKTTVQTLAPEYTHSIPRDAGRELAEEGRTVHLSSIGVEVRVGEGTDGQTFRLEYEVIQSKNRVRLQSVENEFDDVSSAAKLSAAADLADDVVHAFVMDVGLDFGVSNHLTSAGVRGIADVFSDLEVSD